MGRIFSSSLIVRMTDNIVKNFLFVLHLEIKRNNTHTSIDRHRWSFTKLHYVLHFSTTLKIKNRDTANSVLSFLLSKSVFPIIDLQLWSLDGSVLSACLIMTCVRNKIFPTSFEEISIREISFKLFHITFLRMLVKEWECFLVYHKAERMLEFSNCIRQKILNHWMD